MGSKHPASSKKSNLGITVINSLKTSAHRPKGKQRGRNDEGI